MTEENTLNHIWIPRLLLGGLLLLSFWVLQEFLLTLVWALIITYVAWPPYQWLKSRLQQRATLSAALMTLGIAVVLVSLSYVLLEMLRVELSTTYQALFSHNSANGLQLPEAIRRLPGIGHYLQSQIDRLSHDRAELIAELQSVVQQWLGRFAQLLGNIGAAVVKLGVILVTVFFGFRDGEHAILQLRRGLIQFLGKYQNTYLLAIGNTTRAVVYGLVLAAMAQGMMAGVAYAIAGVQAPVLFGVLTAILAMVPMGATLVWFPIAVMLLLTDQYLQGVGLMLWGFLVVSTVDNVIRPLVISGASRVPLLVVMFGVLGGLSAFGTVGIFMGPVILAVLLAVWQAWLQQQQPLDNPEPQGENTQAQPLWHTLTVTQALAQQETELASGLSSTQSSERLKQFGANRLAEAEATSHWRLFFAQFKNVLVMILLLAACIAGMMGDIQDALVILTVVVINASLGFYQELRAEQSLAALKNMLALQSKVRRDGQTQTLVADQLVPGDIVLLEAGDQIPADGRILVAHGLEVDESSLTGESLPVAKHPQALADAKLALAEHSNMLFMNTAVTRGRAEMLVTATGMQTAMGKLAELLAQTEVSATPLQLQLDALGKQLAFIAIGIISVIVSSALWRGEPLVETLMTAIALAIAAIPEGLPAVVTVTLALGMHRMARQRALVKRLAAVETLGCTTVICTDKTGTLTLNQMTARAVYYRGRSLQVTGEGYQAEGAIVQTEDPIALEALLRPLVLCNDSQVKDAQALGDPMESALLVLAAKGGLDISQLQTEYPRVAEIPFDAEHKFMATFHTHGTELCIFIKGAVEILLSSSHNMLGHADLPEALDTEAVLLNNRTLAEQGLRILGIASRTLPLSEFDANRDLFEYIQDLTFIALIGLMDPPRAEVAAAIAQCQHAGIAVKMITGDHPQTAAAIAKTLGLRGAVLEGQRLTALDDATLAAQINDISVFARTAPEQKVRIVKALQAQKHVVAMTGDGVNDAPALKTADIGIAMGISGTDVAKAAAAMILTDDNFASLCTAVREGRGIYANIVKFVRFQLSTNIGAIITVATAPLLGLPVPFTAVQLLWINIIMDGPPAMSLGVDPCSPSNMDSPPRDPAARILNGKRMRQVFGFGLLMACGTLGTLYYALTQGHAEHAATLAFSVFAFFQVFNVFNARNESHTLFNQELFKNRMLWVALLSVVGLQILVVHWPLAQNIFATTDLSLSEWGAVIAISSSVVVLEELRKLMVHVKQTALGAKN